MKKLSLILFTLTFIANAYSQSGYQQKLRDVAVITFPDTPKLEKVASGGTIYIYNGGERCFYLGQVADAKKNFADLLQSHLLDSIYNGFITGNLKGTRGKVFYSKRISIEGLDGIEFAYKGTINGNSCYSYQRAVYFNEILVSYSLWSFDSLAKDDSKIKSYFATFKLNKDIKARQNNAADIGYKTGYAAAAFLFIGGLITIIALIIFLVRRAAKNKQNNYRP